MGGAELDEEHAGHDQGDTEGHDPGQRFAEDQGDDPRPASEHQRHPGARVGQEGFGFAATADGRYLIVVQMKAGRLFRIDTRTREVAAIDTADVALDAALRARLYPFCRLTGNANVLVMPGLHAAHILTKAVPRLTSATTVGPLLMGMSRPVQIAPVDSGVNQLLDMACLAAHAATGTQVATNEEWHYKPVDLDVPMPWRINVKWRISTVAGFEGGTQIYVNTLSPFDVRDRVTATLRDLRHQGAIAPHIRIAEECTPAPNLLRYNPNLER